MSFQPESLEFWVVVRREAMRFKYFIKFSKVSSVIVHNSFSLQNAFILMKMFTSRQGPEKSVKIHHYDIRFN